MAPTAVGESISSRSPVTRWATLRSRSAAKAPTARMTTAASRRGRNAVSAPVASASPGRPRISATTESVMSTAATPSRDASTSPNPRRIPMAYRARETPRRSAVASRPLFRMAHTAPRRSRAAAMRPRTSAPKAKASVGVSSARCVSTAPVGSPGVEAGGVIVLLPGLVSAGRAGSAAESAGASAARAGSAGRTRGPALVGQAEAVRPPGRGARRGAPARSATAAWAGSAAL